MYTVRLGLLMGKMAVAILLMVDGDRMEKLTPECSQSVKLAVTGVLCIVSVYNYFSPFCAGTLGQLPRLETHTKITSALRLAKLLGNTIIYTELHN